MSNARGFSLFEILVTIVIAAMVMVVGLNVTRGRFDAEARRVANKLNGAIHFLYNKAATEGKTYRLVFDLEKQTWWVEVAEGAFLLKTVGDEERKGQREKEKAKEKEKEKAEEPASEESAGTGEAEEAEPVFQSPTETAFSPAADLPRSLAQPAQLPAKVVLRDLFTMQQKGPMTEGKAYIHFFPQGYTEPVILNFTNPDGEKFLALEVNPLTGFTKVFWERRERK